jgi:hypothetical protein
MEPGDLSETGDEPAVAAPPTVPAQERPPRRQRCAVRAKGSLVNWPANAWVILRTTAAAIVTI